jgi:hypothetical protein
MGHISEDKIKRLKDHTLGFEITDIKTTNTTNAYNIATCESCIKAKMTQHINKTSINKEKIYEYLDKIYTDL